MFKVPSVLVVESSTFTVSNNLLLPSSNVITSSHSHRHVHKVKGCYGCQDECSRIFAKSITTEGHTSLTASAVHMRTIVMSYSRAKIQKMITDGWVYCTTCSHAFHPSVCQGKIRKICPCCTTRLNALKTVLKKSTVQKIRDTVLISRVD